MVNVCEQVAIDLDEEQGSSSSDLVRAGSAATSSQDSPPANVVLLDDAQPRSSALLAAETVRRPDGTGVWRRASSSSGVPRAQSAEAAALQLTLREKWARYAAGEASEHM